VCAPDSLRYFTPKSFRRTEKSAGKYWAHLIPREDADIFFFMRGFRRVGERPAANVEKYEVVVVEDSEHLIRL
jgi:hypothetical protein